MCVCLCVCVCVNNGWGYRERERRGNQIFWPKNENVWKTIFDLVLTPLIIIILELFLFTKAIESSNKITDASDFLVVVVVVVRVFCGCLNMCFVTLYSAAQKMECHRYTHTHIWISLFRLKLWHSKLLICFFPSKVGCHIPGYYVFFSLHCVLVILKTI